MKCKICSRETVKEDFCSFHLKANQNIIEKYQIWNNADPLTWCQYLCELQKNSLTGEWAKEVVEYLIEAEKDGIPKRQSI
jgi:hypothetical protein